jgi:uncharacterized protein (TIGR02246 family)
MTRRQQGLPYPTPALADAQATDTPYTQLKTDLKRSNPMKQMFVISIVIAMTALFSSCNAPDEKASATPASAATAAAESSANAEQEIRKLNLEYDTAILKQDVAALERLFAEDFVVTKMGGKLSNKAQEIADAKSGDTKIEVGRSEDVKVRLYGNTAIVNGRWIEKSNTKGKLFDGTHLYTTVYVKRDGKWQIVSDQVTPVTP